MSNIYKGEFQDYEGNVVYPHTSADVVFATDGQTIQKKLNDAEIDYTDVKAQLIAGEHEFRFGVTADGEFGYHKEVEGADTVIPFKGDVILNINGSFDIPKGCKRLIGIALTLTQLYDNTNGYSYREPNGSIIKNYKLLDTSPCYDNRSNLILRSFKIWDIETSGEAGTIDFYEGTVGGYHANIAAIIRVE